MKRAIALAVLASLALAGPVAAGGSIALNSADPHFGGYVTFAITLTGTDAQLDCYGYNHKTCARVEVLCYQQTEPPGGALFDQGPVGGQTLGYGWRVYGEAGDLEQARETGFQLGGAASPWVQAGGGPADCIANLFVFEKVQGQQTRREIATTSFAASG